MHRPEEDQSVLLLRYGKAVLIGGGVAFLVCLAVLLLSSVAIAQGFLSGGHRYQMCVVGCVTGGLIGGVWAVRHAPARGLLVGLATGGVLFLLVLTLSLLLYDAMSFENGGLGILCGALCGGAAAGILAGRGGKPKKKRRR